MRRDLRLASGLQPSRILNLRYKIVGPIPRWRADKISGEEIVSGRFRHCPKFSPRFVRYRLASFGICFPIFDDFKRKNRVCSWSKLRKNPSADNVGSSITGKCDAKANDY